MDKDLELKFKNFAFSETEACGVILPKEITKYAEEDCLISVVIKIYSDKPVKFKGLENILKLIWDFTNGFTLNSLGSNKFHVIFNSVEDVDRILAGCPWFYENYLMVIKQWRKGIEIDSQAFTSGPIWIQLWNVPTEWCSKGAIEYVCSSFGKVRTVIAPITGDMQGMYARCLVEIDFTKPLLRGLFLNQEAEKVWVHFRYEELPFFCFYCGVVGHASRSCYARGLDIKGTFRKMISTGYGLKSPAQMMVLQEGKRNQTRCTLLRMRISLEQLQGKARNLCQKSCNPLQEKLLMYKHAICSYLIS